MKPRRRIVSQSVYESDRERQITVVPAERSKEVIVDFDLVDKSGGRAFQCHNLTTTAARQLAEALLESVEWLDEQKQHTLTVTVDAQTAQRLRQYFPNLDFKEN
jgi:hypothetical protein